MPRTTVQEQVRFDQQGAALAYVLALLAVVGILVGSGWRLIRSNNNLAALTQAEAQAGLLAQSGLSYALAKIGSPGPGQNLMYATDSLSYRLDDKGNLFEIAVRSRGLFARVRSLGKAPLPLPGKSKDISAVLGQALDLGRLPVIALSTRETNLVLLGNTQVTGPVMLWRGRVVNSGDAAPGGGAGHAGALWDRASPAWDLVSPDFGRAEAWMRTQAEVLASGDLSQDPDFDSGMVRDIRLPDSAYLTDTTLANARIFAAHALRLGTGVQLKNCKLVSRDIVIENGTDLQRVVAYAKRNLVLRGGRIRGGQFLAGDSMRISSDVPLEGYPVFYAQGRKENPGRPDSTLIGAMVLEKVTGKGLFLASFREKGVGDETIRLLVKPGVRITGLLYTSGYAQMEGDLEGSLICQNLKSSWAGTIWIGHLKDAHLKALMGKSVVPAPLLFPGFNPVVFAEHFQ